MNLELHLRLCIRRFLDNILKYLDYRPKTVDEIWTEMLSKGEGKTLPEVLNELVEACMQGEVAQVAGSCFIKPGL